MVIFQQATCKFYQRLQRFFLEVFFWVTPEATPKALVPWVILHGSAEPGPVRRAACWSHDLLQQMLQIVMSKIRDTSWKFNIALENIPSEKESSLPTIIFQGLR